MIFGDGLTYTGVDDTPANRSFEEARTAIAAEYSVVLPIGLVATHLVVLKLEVQIFRSMQKSTNTVTDLCANHRTSDTVIFDV